MVAEEEQMQFYPHARTRDEASGDKRAASAGSSPTTLFSVVSLTKGFRRVAVGSAY
jgi:hypothetical protein